ncbi:MAG: hypothetical protein IKU87_01750 [Clostridia bacterium]|nr:hypothetical protein [Clostridia bacterium]
MKKYYFLPFLDNALAVLISLLFSLLFASWFSFKPFAIPLGIAMTLVMCGLIYSRMWKLGRRNVRYNLGLKKSSSIKFVLPLIIFHLLLILLFFLSDKGLLPFKGMVLRTYYTFPDNMPREAINITVFEYIEMCVRLWFSYFLAFSESTKVWILILAPVLTFVSSVFGFMMGSKNKEVTEEYYKTAKFIKKKFNE